MQVNANDESDNVINKQVNASEIVSEITEEINVGDTELVTKEASSTGAISSLDIIAKAQEKIAKAKEEPIRIVSRPSTSGGQKKTQKVKVTVHHKENSQVTTESNSKVQAESTASASEGEMDTIETQSKSVREEILDGLWTVVGGGKRKAKISSDEEGEVIKIGLGSFVNSFFSSSSQRSKKKKEDEASITSRNEEKVDGKGQSIQKASG